MNMTAHDTETFNLKKLYTIGGFAALSQLAAILIYTVAMMVLGPKPTSVEEYFMLQQSSRLASVLRGDFLLLLLLAPYFGTFPALWVATRQSNCCHIGHPFYICSGDNMFCLRIDIYLAAPR
jgi:hypothetical protein